MGLAYVHRVGVCLAPELLVHYDHKHSRPHGAADFKGLARQSPVCDLWQFSLAQLRAKGQIILDDFTRNTRPLSTGPTLRSIERRSSQ